MSKHSMRNGASGSSSASCNASSARPRVVIGRAPQLVPLEGLARVERRRREQLALPAPLRHPDADLRPPGERQELLVELEVLGLDRDEDLLRDVGRRRVGVELLDDARDERRRLDVLDLVDDEALAPDDPPLRT